jgi:mono/diheme cytochrome c family protein
MSRRSAALALVLGFFATLTGRTSYGADEDAGKSPAAVYRENCALCHGEDARGLSGPDYFGPNLAGSAFVRGLSDEALIAFLKAGRAPDAPDSKLHLLMPPCDYLSGAELAALVRFLRGRADAS